MKQLVQGSGRTAAGTSEAGYRSKRTARKNSGTSGVKEKKIGGTGCEHHPQSYRLPSLRTWQHGPKSVSMLPYVHIETRNYNTTD